MRHFLDQGDYVHSSFLMMSFLGLHLSVTIYNILSTLLALKTDKIILFPRPPIITLRKFPKQVRIIFKKKKKKNKDKNFVFVFFLNLSQTIQIKSWPSVRHPGEAQHLARRSTQCILFTLAPFFVAALVSVVAQLAGSIVPSPGL